MALASWSSRTGLGETEDYDEKGRHLSAQDWLRVGTVPLFQCASCLLEAKYMDSSRMDCTGSRESLDSFVDAPTFVVTNIAQVRTHGPRTSFPLSSTLR